MNACPVAKESRRKDAGIVEDEQVTRPEKAGKVAEPLVMKRSALPVKMEQAGACAVVRRTLGNPLWRQGEIKLGDEHRASL